MEDIAHMVSASLARHGFVPRVDHRRLQWSKWSRCESSLSSMPVPSKPGLFALAEETIVGRHDTITETRTLTVFQISEADDVGMALGRLFLPNAAERDRLTTKPCYMRFAVIEDASQRRASYRSLQQWMTSPPELTTEISNNLTVHGFTSPESTLKNDGDSSVGRGPLTEEARLPSEPLHCDQQ